MKPIMMGLLAAGAFAALGTFADPSVTITRVQQRYPWNGLVDIDYTVSGFADDAYACELIFTVKDNTASPVRQHVASNFFAYAACDLPVTDGSYRVTWDSAADGCEISSTNVTVRADLVSPEPARTAATADYMILDLSSGAGSGTYPVRYAAGGTEVAAQFNKALYKTTKLVLRRLPAADFWVSKGNQVNAIVPGTATSCYRARLTQDYYLGLFPVTQQQYLLVQGDNPARMQGTTYGTNLLRPLENASWHTLTNGFLANVSARAKRGAAAVGAFTFPTEVQWERACRADTLTRYWWGDSTYLFPDNFWYYENVDRPGGNGTTMGVGLKLPNPLGFYDMFGNVNEWCLDYYYSAAPSSTTVPARFNGTEASPTVDPFITAADPSVVATLRCYRGGSWGGTGDQYNFGSGIHYAGGTYTSASYQIGFRLALTLPE